jgi:hypothetical protein
MLVDPPERGKASVEFRVGDRVLVTDGYDGDESAWLQGGAGYVGTVVDLTGNWAAVELDDELVLDANEATGGWPDFGSGSAKQLGSLTQARGRWLAVAHGWVGQQWSEPIARLQVGLCSEKPDLSNIPEGGGIGAWVESHATMSHVGDEMTRNT